MCQEELRGTGAFERQVGMLYRDDDDGLLYVTQNVTTQRRLSSRGLRE